MKKLSLILLSLGISFQAFAGFVEGEQAFNEQRYSQAFSEFLPLANDGDFRSQYYVAYLYINGYGVSQNTKEGLKFLQEAVNQNYDMAQALMAYLYSEGKVVSQNKEKAMTLYQQAAMQNNISANLNLGVMYYKGDGVSRNYQKALEYFQKVPLDQNPVVSRYLGDIYLNNASLRDYAKALQYYELSAKQKDLSAYFSLGEMYRKGLGVEQDMTQAITYYKYAASQNYGPAQYMLGIIYANGEGISKDIYKAYAWFHLASEQNLTSAADAQQRLIKNMSLSDVDMARRQVVLIQQNEMGKIDPPLQPDPVSPQVADPTVVNLSNGDTASVASDGSSSAVQNVVLPTNKANQRRGLRRRRR